MLTQKSPQVPQRLLRPKQSPLFNHPAFRDPIIGQNGWDDCASPQFTPSTIAGVAVSVSYSIITGIQSPRTPVDGARVGGALERSRPRPYRPRVSRVAGRNTLRSDAWFAIGSATLRPTRTSTPARALPSLTLPGRAHDKSAQSSEWAAENPSHYTPAPRTPPLGSRGNKKRRSSSHRRHSTPPQFDVRRLVTYRIDKRGRLLGRFETRRSARIERLHRIKVLRSSNDPAAHALADVLDSCAYRKALPVDGLPGMWSSPAGLRKRPDPSVPGQLPAPYPALSHPDQSRQCCPCWPSRHPQAWEISAFAIVESLSAPVSTNLVLSSSPF